MMQETDICLPRSPPPNAGCVGVSLFPWLPLICCDKVTRTNEKRKEKFLAYKEKRAGEWLLGSIGRVALDWDLPQLARNPYPASGNAYRTRKRSSAWVCLD